MASMTKEELEAGVRALAPFHHAIDLPEGVSTFVPDMSRRPRERTRIDSLVRHAWPDLLAACGGSLEGKRVLDVACNCGGFSVEASRSGAARVLGIDVAEHYIRQAQFVQEALGLEGVEFRTQDLLDLDPERERFDVTFCFGILYHLENPILAMRRLAAVTEHAMLIDTAVLRHPLLRRKPLWRMNFPPPATAASQDATTSLWRKHQRFCQFSPSARAVTELLQFLGFAHVTRLKPRVSGLEKRYYKGTRATFLAVR